ncbi:hypothetical protein J5X07_01555 [Actinomyces bowdenii]|uniref:Uncharacterized protein n=1 Tax=Actinomyces bowdenii TaxID=131109 RepID=A0A3P1V9B3_9ACTO|nr:hypothetical protein [Actinomyces bowdenii]MBO3723729.1 hypothetical protein [Actinomyces bowdenii]RRD30804.1 hypothetical protein EII10_01485 [Actinomyces bowdenii]
MTAQHDWSSSSPQPGPIPHSSGSYGAAPQEPGAPRAGDRKGSGKDEAVHTYLYYPAFAVAIVLGGILALVLYVWIGNSTTGSTRIPVILLAAPALILVGAVRLGDSHVARKYPNLVPASKRAAVAGSGAGPAGGQGSTPPQHPYGRNVAHAPQAPYGQAAPQGRSDQPGQAPYGSVPNPPTGYGRPGQQL